MELSNLSSQTYDHVVNGAILQRFRIVSIFGAFLYLAFSGLDFVVYPEHWAIFFTIRLFVSLSLLITFALSFLPFIRSLIIWLVDFVILMTGMGIILMIFQSQGLQSGYYQGLNLVFLGMFTMNSFRPHHNVGVGALLLLAYLIAIKAHPVVGIDLAGLASPLFFMGSTLAFVYIMTELYARQHFNEFVKSKELALSASQLAQAHSSLLALEKLKDNFIANISHELRTPLTLILGPIRKHLAESKLFENLRCDLEIVERNALTLLKCVNDLLDISKLAAQKMHLNYQKIDLSKLVRFTASHFEALALDKNITFVLETPASLIAQCDKAKIERVLFNLLSNAFKFTPRDGSITYSLSQKGSDAVIFVKDSGPGIDRQLQEVIFERFRQGEDSDTRKFGGTGLGLAISKEFIELHQGQIEVSSLVHCGSVFTITFPLSAPVGTSFSSYSEEELSNQSQDIAAQITAEHDIKINRQKPNFGSAISRSSSKPSIILIEDNQQVSDFIADALRKQADVFQAFDGREGLDLLAEGPCDLIITDIMMPTMSGDQFIQVVRAYRKYENIPILVLTAKADETLRERLLVQGAQDFLCKPFSLIELQARVANFLQIKQVRDVLEKELSRRSDDIVAMTYALADSKLKAEKALQFAEAAATAKDEFLMNLSHELRTPLTAILGWAELLEGTVQDDPELKEGLSIILRNSRVQMRLIDDLLDLSRIIQGKLEIEMKPVNIQELVKLSVNSITAAAKAKNINLIVDLSKDLPFSLNCDFDRIQQVLWNLLTNAVKFTSGQGFIMVTVDVEEEAVVFKVKDSGKGIEPDKLETAFERLRQLDQSTTKIYGGLGLGLAIARHLVELHGGTISAESKGIGCGSTFIFSIPFKKKKKLTNYHLKSCR